MSLQNTTAEDLKLSIEDHPVLLACVSGGVPCPGSLAGGQYVVAPQGKRYLAHINNFGEQASEYFDFLFRWQQSPEGVESSDLSS